MPPPGRGETLVLESLDPDDLDPGVHQPLRALALDKVVGLADADEAAAHARGDEFRRYTYGDVLEDPRLMLNELRGLLSVRVPAEQS